MIRSYRNFSFVLAHVPLLTGTSDRLYAIAERHMYLAKISLDDYRRLWPSLSGVETKKLSYAANAKKMARSESHRAKCFGVSRLW